MVNKYIPKNRKEAYIRLLMERSNIQKSFPNFLTHVNGDTLVSTGPIQPTEYSQKYTIKITYRWNNNPKVIIVHPKIQFDKNIHMYSDGTLCLYYWKEQPWQNTFHINETIIPWVAEWLVHYEIYELTGKWLGQAVEHSGDKQKEATIN